MSRSFPLCVMVLVLVAMLLASGCGGGGGNVWLAVVNGNTVQISYGNGTDFPQYAALHLDSSYLRLIPTRNSGWGTSVILMPALWSGGTYYQGAPVTVAAAPAGDDLLVNFAGTIAGLQVQGQVRLSPPDANGLQAVVAVVTTGGPALDNRPGEAFKPVMLSSMHISPTQWDTQSGFVDAQNIPLPANGWILNPPVDGTVFGLTGGTSAWKANAPTVEITLDQSRAITGWVTASADPNDDNIAFWAASDTVLANWSYTVVAR